MVHEVLILYVVAASDHKNDRLLKWIFGPRNVVLASQNLGIEILIFLIVLPLFNLRKKLQLQSQ